MTITDIDKQKEKLRQEFLDIALPGRHKKHLPEQIIKDAEKTETKLFNWLYSKIYSQAKAEQREELREKVERKKRSVYMLNNSEFTDYQAKEWNDALDEVLSLIPKSKE